VLVHELSHIAALEIGGVPAHLQSFSAAMPRGYLWTFRGLDSAKGHLGVPDRVFVIAALAGPTATLLIAYGGLLLNRWKSNRTFWAIAFAAIGVRTFGVTLNMPRFLDGSMDTSDEAIAAHFSGVPLSTFYWPSLVLGYVCIFLLIKFAARGNRFSFCLSAFVGGTAGYLIVDTLVNLFILKPEVWMR
jgi:hypothetical protein